MEVFVVIQYEVGGGGYVKAVCRSEEQADKLAALLNDAKVERFEIFDMEKPETNNNW